MLRVAGRGHAFAGVMDVRMAKLVRLGQAGVPPGVGPLARHAALHATAKRGGHVRVPLLERPPGAPVGGAAAGEEVGATRRAVRAAPPHGGHARVDRRVAAEGLPVAGAVQLLPLLQPTVATRLEVTSQLVQGAEGVSDATLQARKAAGLPPAVAALVRRARTAPCLPVEVIPVRAPSEVVGRPGDVAPERPLLLPP